MVVEWGAREKGEIGKPESYTLSNNDLSGILEGKAGDENQLYLVRS
jgi:hypothetical protein